MSQALFSYFYKVVFFRAPTFYFNFFLARIFGSGISFGISVCFRFYGDLKRNDLIVLYSVYLDGHCQ